MLSTDKPIYSTAISHDDSTIICNYGNEIIGYEITSMAAKYKIQGNHFSLISSYGNYFATVAQEKCI